MLILAVPSALVIAGLAIKFISDVLEEKMVRAKQVSIRAAKQRYLAVQEENRGVARDIQRKRSELEYLRRGALIAYHEHRKQFLIDVRQDLREAKVAAFGNMYALHRRLQLLEGWKSLPSTQKVRYFTAKVSVHLHIKRMKQIEALASSQIRLSQEALHRLRDSSTHRRLGAKKAIKEFLEERAAQTRVAYSHRQANGLALPFSSTQLFLDVRCQNAQCRVHLAPEMQFCFACGESREEGVALVVSGGADNGIPCACCGAEIDEMFSYCFNCGQRHDPFGLLTVYKA